MFFDTFHRHSPSSLHQAFQEVEAYNLCSQIFGHAMVEFREILPFQWRGRWPKQAKRLLALLEDESYQPEPYNMVYPHFHGPRDIDLIMCRNARHAIGWWPIDNESVELEMVYRHVDWEKHRECKAREFIQTFTELCRKAGFKRVELHLQPFSLHPRLPYRKNIKSDPDTSPQLELDGLKELYSRLGFKKSGEAMVLVL